MLRIIFHFFKIHLKVIFGNPSLVIQNMFDKAPKPISVIDRALASVRKGFTVIQVIIYNIYTTSDVARSDH
ncbi:MAG: hypothetical protein A2844_01090 [Candidatus Ryanbacteria bacterium RIFCSPHIGHO2_01_FULL_48_80]|nr:MAG: hypothetical protein A2844_01090 [Candidatus Ryanbacteria bacterium RIFCSPHIGHO2_01_FULL_48_80]